LTPQKIVVDCRGHMAAADSDPQEECGMGLLVLHVPVGVARRVIKVMSAREPVDSDEDGPIYARAEVHITITELEDDLEEQPNEGATP